MNPTILRAIASPPKPLFKQLTSGSERHAKKRIRQSLMSITDETGKRVISRQAAGKFVQPILAHFRERNV